MSLVRIRLLSTIPLLVALAVPAVAASSAPASAASTGVHLYNCSTLTTKPAEIVLTCADANRYVAGITWTSWTATRATATGVVHWNGCTPSCAAGTWHTRSISFSARDPKSSGGDEIFTQLVGPSGVWGVKGLVWDLPVKPL